MKLTMTRPEHIKKMQLRWHFKVWNIRLNPVTNWRYFIKQSPYSRFHLLGLGNLVVSYLCSIHTSIKFFFCSALGTNWVNSSIIELLKVIDYLDSRSGKLFLLKCWNLWFFIVVWKGSLSAMQETERLPCSKNARFPGPSPWAPSRDRSQNISSFRIQGHCIFILIHFCLLWSSRKCSRSCSSSSGLGYVSYPGSDLLFRLAVASSGLQCVTDTEDIQLAKGQGGVLKTESRPAMCVFLPSLWILCRFIYTPTLSVCLTLHLATFLLAASGQWKADDAHAD